MTEAHMKIYKYVISKFSVVCDPFQHHDKGIYNYLPSTPDKSHEQLAMSNATSCILLIYNIVLREKEIFHKKTPWPELASELYRTSYRCLLAKLVIIFSG